MSIHILKYSTTVKQVISEASYELCEHRGKEMYLQIEAVVEKVLWGNITSEQEGNTMYADIHNKKIECNSMR